MKRDSLPGMTLAVAVGIVIAIMNQEGWSELLDTELSEPLQLCFWTVGAVLAITGQASQLFAVRSTSGLPVKGTCMYIILHWPILESAISQLEKGATWLCHFRSLLKELSIWSIILSSTAREHELSKTCLIGYFIVLLIELLRQTWLRLSLLTTITIPRKAMGAIEDPTSVTDHLYLQ